MRINDMINFHLYVHMTDFGSLFTAAVPSCWMKLLLVTDDSFCWNEQPVHEAEPIGEMMKI